jgi:hypothetical protein
VMRHPLCPFVYCDMVEGLLCYLGHVSRRHGFRLDRHECRASHSLY